MTARWHIHREPGALTLSRTYLPRFDIAARTAFGQLRMLPLAQMVRQDMWRMLRSLRGFAPVVRVAHGECGLLVTAGGSLACPAPKAQAEARIYDLLHSPCHRARWMRCARLPRDENML